MPTIPYHTARFALSCPERKAEDEEDGGDYVSRCCKTQNPLLKLFTIF